MWFIDKSMKCAGNPLFTGVRLLIKSWIAGLAINLFTEYILKNPLLKKQTPQSRNGEKKTIQNTNPKETYNFFEILKDFNYIQQILKILLINQQNVILYLIVLVVMSLKKPLLMRVPTGLTIFLLISYERISKMSSKKSFTFLKI